MTGDLDVTEMPKWLEIREAGKAYALKQGGCKRYVRFRRQQPIGRAAQTTRKRGRRSASCRRLLGRRYGFRRWTCSRTKRRQRGNLLCTAKVGLCSCARHGCPRPPRQTSVSFTRPSPAGSKKATGFLTRVKKQSMFAVPQGGKVGVTGSGQGMTSYQVRVRCAWALKHDARIGVSTTRSTPRRASQKPKKHEFRQDEQDAPGPA